MFSVERKVFEQGEMEERRKRDLCSDIKSNERL